MMISKIFILLFTLFMGPVFSVHTHRSIHRDSVEATAVAPTVRPSGTPNPEKLHEFAPGVYLPIGQVTWTGKLEANGRNISVTGNSLDHIDYKLRQNPKFNAEQWKELIKQENITRHCHKHQHSHHPHLLDKRQRQRRLQRSACQRTSIWLLGVEPQEMNRPIRKLFDRPGDCSIAKRTCVKLACHEWKTIMWCNNNSYGLRVPCRDLAEMSINLQHLLFDDARNSGFFWDWCDFHDTISEKVYWGQTWWLDTNRSWDLRFQRMWTRDC